MKAVEYLKEVKAELTHVSWPTRRQTMLFTAFVIVLSTAVSIYLGVFDFIFKQGVETLILK